MNIGFGNSWKPGYMHGATFVGGGDSHAVQGTVLSLQ